MLALLLFVLAQASDDRPVSKVIKLLKDIHGQLEAEKKADEETWEKLSCWCEVNGREKNDSVEKAARTIAELTATIESLTAKGAGLEQSIAGVDQETAANKESLGTAAELRAKEAAEFHAEDKDMLLSIDSLKNAIVVLERTQSSSFLQTGAAAPATAFLEAKRQVARVVQNHDDIIDQILNPTDKQLIREFVQAGVAPASYAPKGGQIMGVLKQMKENFESNLSAASAAENKAKNEFAELKAAKTSEIKSGEQQASSQRAVLAKTSEARAAAKEDLETTEGSLTSDQKFLIDLKERCSMSDAEWQSRSKARGEEIRAVSETIAMLASDDSHDLFGRTLSFLDVRVQVSGKLEKAAQRTHSAALLAVAQAVKTDVFAKVLEKIQGMIGELKQQQDDEVKHRDWCTEELHQNDLARGENTNNADDLAAQIGVLQTRISTLTDELEALSKAVAEMHLQQQRASENRMAESREFQTTVSDQRATQDILKKALDRLRKFYGSSLLQKPRSLVQGGPPPPPGFSEYKPNSGAGGVMTMIQSVITDAQEMEKEAAKDEQDAQSAYEAFVKNTNDSVRAAQKAQVAKAEEKAKAEQDLAAAEADAADAAAEGEALARTNADVHGACDFVVANFDARQENRGQEMQGLKDAMAAIKGAAV